MAKTGSHDVAHIVKDLVFHEYSDWTDPYNAEKLRNGLRMSAGYDKVFKLFFFLLYFNSLIN